ncbi:MAG: response regulator transcription factor [Phycisphaerales bacterium]|nr:response regulator transcription factor [Phycisphaerales bacterium]
MKPLTVLLVEDDAKVISALRDGLTQHNVKMVAATTLADARKLLSQPGAFDAMVLDLNLPDGNGTELAEQCRKAGNDVPIIMVTARDRVQDRIAGLRHGADDYLCKPFAVEELVARLDAILRRTRSKDRHILKFGDLTVDLVRRQATRAGVDVSLSARELDLLAYFMCHPNEVLEKERILRNVWGDEGIQDSNVLHVYANYLRNKLEQGRYSRLLHTVRGVGYVLATEPPQT